MEILYVSCYFTLQCVRYHDENGNKEFGSIDAN